MRELLRSIEIDAPTMRVWNALVDFDAYPDWNPLIRSIHGELREGGKLAVRAEFPGGVVLGFRPTVLAVEPGHELSWAERLLTSSVFEGVHRFVLQELGPERCRFVQAERFSGLLAHVSGGLIRRNATGYDRMNAALKVWAEKTAAADPSTA